MSIFKDIVLPMLIMLIILLVLILIMSVVIHITGIDMPIRIIFFVISVLIFRKFLEKY